MTNLLRCRFSTGSSSIKSSSGDQFAVEKPDLIQLVALLFVVMLLDRLLTDNTGRQHVMTSFLPQSRMVAVDY